MTGESPRVCVVVSGSGRCGTSAIAGSLHRLGVDFGGKHVAVDRRNAKGFYEDADVVALNNRLLAALGSYNGDFMPLPEAWVRLEAARPFRGAIAELLEARFRSSSLWGVKDPRLSKTWPLWNELMRDGGIEPRHVIVFRHPDEVALSMELESTSINHGFLKWITSNLELVRETRDATRTCVDYDALLAEPTNVLTAIAERLRLARAILAAEEEVGNFLDASMRHFRGESERVAQLADRPLRDLARDMFTSLRAVATIAGPPAELLSAHAARWETMMPRYAGWRVAPRAASRAVAPLRT